MWSPVWVPAPPPVRRPEPVDLVPAMRAPLPAMRAPLPARRSGFYAPWRERMAILLTLTAAAALAAYWFVAVRAIADAA